MNLKRNLEEKGKPFSSPLPLSLSLSSLSARNHSRPEAFLFLTRAQRPKLAQSATPPAQHRPSPFFF
jgi:hypothetical protein